MKLKHEKGGEVSQRAPLRQGMFARMKDMAASAAITGAALLIPAMAGCDMEGIRCAPTDQYAPATQDAGDEADAASPAYCTKAPEIEEWSLKRRLEPRFVRAIAITQSNLDECAAAAACNTGVIDASCLEPGPAIDTGYGAALDEMHDPAGVCSFNNASPAPQGPAWRWLGLGIMQTLEPPYTYWPAESRLDGADGEYNDVFRNSPLYGSLGLEVARACNPRFNPFNAHDSACLGTAKLAILQNAARAWIARNRARLGIGDGETELAARMTMYVAAHMYYGSWASHTRSSSHPRCDPSMTNGDCWAYGYSISRAITEEYCGSNEGEQDTDHCEYGHPASSPPVVCFGYGDFVRYVRDCEVPYLLRQNDYGASVLSMYDTLRADCRSR